MSNNGVKSLSSVIVENLKKEILNLELLPGESISESKICDKFSVSRTPVRDALWSLQEQGYITNIPYRGAYVKKLNYSEIKQMIYMRMAVEYRIMLDFMEVATPMVLEKINYIIRKQEIIILEENFKSEEFYHLDSKMHAIWFEFTGKEKIWDIIQGSQINYTRYRMLDFGVEIDFNRIIQDHKILLDIIQNKEKDKLEEALRQHLFYSVTRTKQQIKVEYKDYFEDI